MPVNLGYPRDRGVTNFIRHLKRTISSCIINPTFQCRFEILYHGSFGSAVTQACAFHDSLEVTKIPQTRYCIRPQVFAETAHTANQSHPTPPHSKEMEPAHRHTEGRPYCCDKWEPPHHISRVGIDRALLPPPDQAESSSRAEADEGPTLPIPNRAW